MENLSIGLERYIFFNYEPEEVEATPIKAAASARLSFVVAPNFRQIYNSNKGESFSEMLLRLIAESGETFAEVYNRAGINRQHFYKIRHNENYKPGKQTAVAFAFALKLSLEKTQALLETAGYTLTKNNLGDVIEIFFLEHEIYDFDTVNHYLEDYHQPLLGDWKFNLPAAQINKIPLQNPPRNLNDGSASTADQINKNPLHNPPRNLNDGSASPANQINKNPLHNPPRNSNDSSASTANQINKNLIHNPPRNSDDGSTSTADQINKIPLHNPPRNSDDGSASTANPTNKNPLNNPPRNSNDGSASPADQINKNPLHNPPRNSDDGSASPANQINKNPLHNPPRNSDDSSASPANQINKNPLHNPPRNLNDGSASPKSNLAGDQINKKPLYNPPRNSKGGSALKNVTEIVFILDRSGSMEGLESDTIGGFNSTLKQNQNSDGDAIVSTVLFDDVSEVIHDRVPIAEVPPLTEKEYWVRGMTALLDAVGDAIKHIRNVHKYARDEDRPAKTLFVITTDGKENASTRYTYAAIKELIQTQKNNGWEFLFLGANIDSVQVSGRMGISPNRAVNYHNDRQGTDAKFRSVSSFVSAARSSASFAGIGNKWREEVDRDFNSRKPKR